MESLIFLAVVLLLGTLSSIVALKLQVSNVFFLVFIGMVFGITGIVEFPKEAIVTITTIALIFIIFNSVAKFKFNELLRRSSSVFKLTGIFLLLTLAGMGAAVYYLFELDSIILAGLFAALMYGIDPAVALVVLEGKKNKISDILEIESIINTPITVIIPLTLLNILNDPSAGVDYLLISEQFIPFIQQFMVAIGVGVTSGLIIIAILKKKDLGNVAYIVLMSTAIMAYVLAEVMKGNGVLSVTIFGLIFGNYHINKKLELEKFTTIFSDALQIVVFILIGTIIFIPYEPAFLLKGTLLFLFYIVLRFISVQISVGTFKLKEKLFMTMNVPKGVDVAVIILIIVSGSYINIENIETILNLCLLFVLYSIVLSTVVTRFTNTFLNIKLADGVKHGKKK